LLSALSAAAAEKSILVVGDSLSAAYGLARSQGWVALLAERLKRERLDYSVVNASISGDTTAGGRARIGELLAKNRPAVVILELGGNDGLRGLPIAQMKANLGTMIERSKKAGARVLLVGMRMPPNYGPDYTEAFDNAFADVAKRYRVELAPFILDGFGDKPEYFQADRIHPTAEVQPLILERIWRGLRPLLK
jgi:acyl-CoA thioesterase-1